MSSNETTQLPSSRDAMDVVYEWQDEYRNLHQYEHAIACDIVVDWLDGVMKGLPRERGWAAMRNALSRAASDERDDPTADVARRALDHFLPESS